MVQSLSRCRGQSTVHDERTDGQTLPTRCEEREDDHEEFVEYETDPYSSCKIEPEPSQLDVCLGRLPLALGTTRLSLLCYVISEFHPFILAPHRPPSGCEGFLTGSRSQSDT